VKSRKRRGFEDYWTRFTANFKSKPEASEEENDKSIETENDDEEPSEFGRRLSIIQVMDQVQLSFDSELFDY